MTEKNNQDVGCIALGVGVLAFLGLGWMVLPQLLFSSRRHYNAVAEARTYVGSMNRAQQAYHLEWGEFAPSLAALELGIKAETENYLYRTQVLNDQVLNDGVVQNSAISKGEGMYHMTGLVWPVEGAPEGLKNRSQLCQGEQRTETVLVPPPSTLVQVLHWFRSEQSAAMIDIPPGTIPTFELPTGPITSEIEISCPAGYRSLQ